MRGQRARDLDQRAAESGGDVDERTLLRRGRMRIDAVRVRAGGVGGVGGVDTGVPALGEEAVERGEDVARGVADGGDARVGKVERGVPEELGERCACFHRNEV